MGRERFFSVLHMHMPFDKVRSFQSHHKDPEKLEIFNRYACVFSWKKHVVIRYSKNSDSPMFVFSSHSSDLFACKSA